MSTTQVTERDQLAAQESDGERFSVLIRMLEDAERAQRDVEHEAAIRRLPRNVPRPFEFD